jgi:hypothetical protein
MYPKGNLRIVTVFVSGWLLSSACMTLTTLPAATPSPKPAELPEGPEAV